MEIVLNVRVQMIGRIFSRESLWIFVANALGYFKISA